MGVMNSYLSKHTLNFVTIAISPCTPPLYSTSGKNILVFEDGRTVKLADFGSAMRKEEVSMKGSPVAFTTHYSAPEVDTYYIYIYVYVIISY